MKYLGLHNSPWEPLTLKNIKFFIFIVTFRPLFLETSSRVYKKMDPFSDLMIFVYDLGSPLYFYLLSNKWTPISLPKIDDLSDSSYIHQHLKMVPEEAR